MSRNSVRRVISVLLVLCMLLTLPAFAAEGDVTVTEIEKYGNLDLSISGTEFLNLGYAYGDLIDVTIGEKTYTMPVGTNYSDVDSGMPVCRVVVNETAEPAEDYVVLAINMGNLAEDAGVATKVTEEDGSYHWEYLVEQPVVVTFAMKEQGGYYDEWLMRQLTRTNDRADYAELTDAEFANFRMVETSGIGVGTLYRSSSPVNPELGRNAYADAAMRAAGVQTVMNLADSEETMQAYPGYADSYYSTANVIALNLGVDFTAADFQSGLARGLRYFLANDGPYLVHCSEGKDRAGFVSALLECLAGATAEEVVEDYMVTYYNYYHVEKGTEQYDAIANSNIKKSLATAFDLADITAEGVDLSAEAAAYMTEKLGLTEDEVAALKAKLTADDANTYQFAVLSTTDMHGRSTTNDVATQQEEPNSMERVSTVVKQERETWGDNMLLVDNGDTIQGTLVAQYAITYQPEEQNPMVEIMGELGYDAWVMGNHEFNFTPEQRDTQVKFAEDAGVRVLSGNVVRKEVGKNAAGEDVEAGDPFYAPYLIKTLDAGNGRTVRVAVIGLSNAANATWDPETNYPGLQFSALDNPDGLLENEINKWSQEIVDRDLADIIIVSAHSGKGNDTGTVFETRSLESQFPWAAENAKNVDLILYGHDHMQNIETVKNADGKEIYMVNGGGTAVMKNVFTVRFDETGKVADFSVNAEALDLSETQSDEALGEKLQPWYDDTYAWASAPLGTFDGGWSDLTAQAEGKGNNEMTMEQTALIDLIHKAQIWSSWRNYESDGIEGATVSLVSPVFATDAEGHLRFIPKDGDTVSMLELSLLYKYSNNLLCAVEMTPQQLYDWMSAVADMYDLGEDGAVSLNASVYGVDTFYGVDYTFDLTKPKGERVTYAKYQGADLLDYEGKIRVALNSYRLSGAYGFFEATGLTEADCYWTAAESLGADHAPCPTQLGEYIQAQKTVTPNDPVSHGEDAIWRLRTQKNPYTDLAENRYYSEPILRLTEDRIMNGMENNTFQTETTFSRAMIVTMLWRYDGRETGGENPFTDVAEGKYYTDAVIWAAKNGIVNGKGDHAFKPDDMVTREEIVTMLYRYCLLKGMQVEETQTELDFADAGNVSDYAQDAMQWAVTDGIINGSDGQLLPKYDATRGQAATIFYRFIRFVEAPSFLSK